MKVAHLFNVNFLFCLALTFLLAGCSKDSLTEPVNLASSDDQVEYRAHPNRNFNASLKGGNEVPPVDTDATAAMSKAAAEAGIPMVYLNREPVNVNELPETQSFVGSNEIESGTLSAFEVCKELRAAGKSGGANVVVMMGQLSNQAAVQRSYLPLRRKAGPFSHAICQKDIRAGIQCLKNLHG